MKKLVYSAKSLRKIQEIESYLKETYDGKTAGLFRTTLKARLQSLKRFPYQGSSLRDLYGFDTNFRHLYVPPHHVFYDIRGDEIEIINLYHDKEDYFSKLFE